MAGVLPEKNEQYGTKEYWDQRYSQDEKAFDWFKSYADIAPLLMELIPNKNARILMLGCGNSKLSEEMYDDGYKNIVNVDYSGVLIAKMRETHSICRPEMEWHEMDVRDLQFDSETFDVAIDKGTMDAMMTAKGDVWVRSPSSLESLGRTDHIPICQDPPEQVIHSCNREVDEVLRVLRKSDSVFIYLTFGQPHFRRRYLTRPDTKLEIRALGEAFHYYLYILTK